MFVILSSSIQNKITKSELICVGVVGDSKNILKDLKLVNGINTGAAYVTHHTSDSGQSTAVGGPLKTADKPNRVF